MTRVIRGTTVSVRVDDATAEAWRQQAAEIGLSVSDWIRGAVDAGQQTRLPTPRKRPARPPRDTSNDADPALMRELAALGSNMNQIARALNSCRSKGDRLPGAESMPTGKRICQGRAKQTCAARWNRERRAGFSRRNAVL